MTQARQQMTMRATIRRPGGAVSDGVDEWGGEVHDDEPDAWIADLACYAWAPSDLREVLDDAKLGVFGALRIVCPVDAAIREGDIVEQIVDRRGVEVFPGPMTITGVTRRVGHLAIMARTQKSLRAS